MSRRRVIGVVTVARSDYGMYLPVLHRIKADPALRLRLYVGGMHWSARHGNTHRMIEADGFTIDEKIDMGIGGDGPADIARVMGAGVDRFGRAFARRRPDILLVLGDRFDMVGAALAALPFKIPVAHIHGGEVTEGAIDDSLRHAITKLSHLHFVTNAAHRRRVIQMGETPWRVAVSGSPGLDNLKSVRLLTPRELEQEYGLDLADPPLLVTLHPVTLEFEQTAWHVRELLKALRASGRSVVFTLPNADTAGYHIIRAIRAFARSCARAKVVDNLGTRGYFSMMAHAAAMVGNSSSGIIEAASFRLPVVNIGTRQRGRLCARNVIDTGYEAKSIEAGIRRATSASFRHSLRSLVNPYGRGCAAEKIVSVLRGVVIDQRLLMKRFHDIGDI